MSNHDDAAFVRTFSLVLVGLTVVGLTAFVLAKLVNHSHEESAAASTSPAGRIAPVGQVNVSGAPLALAGTAPAAPAGDTPAAAAPSSDPGKTTYDKACFACHAQGIAGAPKHADKAAWEPRLAQGRDTLVAHAINGFTGAAGMMPARGGNPTLSDAEVTAGVDYMLAAVGVGAAPAAEAAPAPAAPAEPATATEPAAAVAPVAQAAPAADSKGKEVYDAACTVCHAAGIAGAPKLGDQTAWAPRIAKGLDTLYHSSINGFMGTAGMMPPKGGRPDFNDEDVKAAVDYMVSASK